MVPPGRKAFSNRVRYTRRNDGSQLAIDIGAQKIYFKPGVTTQITITNLMPPPAGGCPAPCTPNMDHFKAFLMVVDKKFDSAPSLVSFTPPTGLLGVEPDYCPGSRV